MLSNYVRDAQHAQNAVFLYRECFLLAAHWLEAKHRFWYNMQCFRGTELCR